MVMSVLLNSKYGELPNKWLNALNIELWPPWVDWNAAGKPVYDISWPEDSPHRLGLDQLFVNHKEW